MCIWECAVRHSMCAWFRLWVRQADFTKTRWWPQNVCVFGGVLQNHDAIFQCVFVCVRASTHMCVPVVPCTIGSVRARSTRHCWQTGTRTETRDAWDTGTESPHRQETNRKAEFTHYYIKILWKSRFKSFDWSCSVNYVNHTLTQLNPLKQKALYWFKQYIINRFVWFACRKFLQDKIT